eukprot:TRINITY_DN12632_c0_g1_i8.p1 TRINITY_DN12632_c0_g1~~TRINITY_DN12632_c0_g1_i8.p1  ORF type:complete len:402 (-),score=121.53 TRINITY_DN12632_c0_g1_i8:71-1276(-)
MSKLAGRALLQFFFFFFKQKTAYEMLRSLVGSEMCIRDRHVPTGGESPTATGQAAIQSMIMDQLNGPCEVKQLSWSHQRSEHGSLVLTVAGQLQSGCGIRRFMETFVLVPESGRVMVKNDICCFFDEQSAVPVQQAPAVDAPAMNIAVETAAVALVEEAVEEPPIPAPQNGQPVQPAVVEPPVPKSPELPATEPSPQEVIAPAPEVQPASAEQEPVKPAALKPSSWAGIAGLSCPKPVAPEKQQPIRRPAPAKTIAVENETNPADEAVPRVQEDRTASVFVTGVPNGCEKENLEEVMTAFGEVKKIVIKADKHYAIIDFAEPDGAQRALDAPAPKYDGSILKIEKRREAATRGGKGGKDGGRGKGGKDRGGGKPQENASDGGFTMAGKGGRAKRTQKPQRQ